MGLHLKPYQNKISIQYINEKQLDIINPFHHHFHCNILPRFSLTQHCLLYLPSQQTPKFPTTKCFCVEIKPKLGYINNKINMCEFQLKQNFKYKQGKIKKYSSYCPLQLYSDDINKVKSAINFLIKSPQNNFLIFMEGEQFQYNEDITLLESELSKIFKCSPVLEKFCELLCQILMKKSDKNCQYHSGILKSILNVQNINKYTINHVYSLYKKCLLYIPDLYKWSFLKLWQICKHGKYKDHSSTSNLIKHLNILLKFLIALSAKDCSIMITMQGCDGSCTPINNKICYRINQFNMHALW
ncbi:inositol-pentakisphosphate 2-kinase-like [Gordionus sp. m RMFG-2023]|uniref:inositol-pentakisphosphate 2-kinase-like n=1 Tax=Gordionus sp. m RMFG-2023 TaxID=3053472 RepID=UPI0031FBCFB0